MSLKKEIFEQPTILRNLIKSQFEQIQLIAEEIRTRQPNYVFLAARGTSDHAGIYATYLLGAYNRLPVALATPSLYTLYGQPPNLSGALVLGISQSGQSPDIVAVVEEGRRQGCLTLSITNAANSPLAAAAEFMIDVQAGEEKAVAATKTYTAQLMSVALLSVALAKDSARLSELEKTSDWLEQVLRLDETIAQIARRYCHMERCVVLGRGFNYATAFEWSLKMKELSYVLAQPYSSADFLHGPIAVVEHNFPVMALAPSGKVFESMLDVLKRLREEHSADLLVISDRPEALELAQSPIPVPGDMPEWLSPIVCIAAAQLFSFYLTQEKGLDTESPRSIIKVTRTE